MKVLEDAQLIKEYKLGNEGAFEKLLSKYKLPLFNYILKMVRGKNIAEDIFQNVWVAVIKSLPRYREQNKFGPFIFKLAHSKTIDYLRKSKLIGTQYIEPLLRAFKPAEESTIESEFEKQELVSILNDAISKLPVTQREVLLLRQHTGLSFKQIAQILDCPLNTALSRMHNAILSLRKVIRVKSRE